MRLFLRRFWAHFAFQVLALTTGMAQEAVEWAPKSVFPVEQLFADALQGGQKTRRQVTAILVDDPEPEHDWLLTILATANARDVFQVEINRNRIFAKLKLFHPVTHLAILEIPVLPEAERCKISLPTVEVNPASDLQVFPGSISQGYPALAGKLAFREVVDPSMPRVWRIVAPLADGWLGSPVFTPKGELLGLVWQLVQPENPLGFRVIGGPSVQAFLQDVTTQGKPVERWFGILFQENSLAPVVVGLTGDSPAVDAGLESGDILLSLAGQPLHDLQDFADIRITLPLGVPTELVYLRGLQQKQCLITPRQKLKKM